MKRWKSVSEKEEEEKEEEEEEEENTNHLGDTSNPNR